MLPICGLSLFAAVLIGLMVSTELVLSVRRAFPVARVKPVLLVLVFGLFALRAPASLSPGQVKLSVVFSF